MRKNRNISFYDFRQRKNRLRRTVNSFIKGKNVTDLKGSYCRLRWVPQWTVFKADS
ncbi:hypothetical protein LBBP_00603 [Leptospira borgpetersenii serovar Ballum]|uniref:Uncharacterized protein n=1 Tax=Leptospira borgpetersenii serovar Ballum TaxID=280505 RepID=A0A0S2IN67_LEPBO|nr:hypothetical protein LBBP_00603 [Leptospira borgpetersenii serovar Ballum]